MASQPPKRLRLSVIEREIARRRAEEQREATRRDADAIRARCSTLRGFVAEAWKILEPDTPFVPNWHIDAICEHLEAVTDGRINRLVINVPPGSSKSMIVSVLWPAWEWGPKGRRSLRYIATAFNETPVKRDTRKSRDLILSEWFRALWPEVVLTRTGEMSFANSSTGTREGIPFGSLTSMRGNRLIIDDPHSTKTAESDTERPAVTRQFLEGARNRLNDQTRDAIIVVMQRLHADDLAGMILSRRLGYVHLMIPMEFEVDRRCETSIGWRDPRTYDRELLDPIRFGPEVVADLKKGGSFFWSGQYQQRPTAREGGLFKRAWFEGRIIDRDSLPRRGMRYARGWDFAATLPRPGASPDWSAGVLMARHGSDYYVVGVDRFQDTAGNVRATVKARAETDPPGTVIRIPQEPGQAGVDQVAQYVTKLAGYTLKAVRPTGAKAIRADPFAVQVENGNVYLVNSRPIAEGIDPWITTFLDEVCEFPGGSHDDQVDAAADAFNELALGSMDAFTSASAGPRETLKSGERDTRHRFDDNAEVDEGSGYGSAPSIARGISF